MKITRLPCDPGPAGWDRLLPEAAPVVPLGTSVTADWLVIGAGYAGLAAARRLSQLCPQDRIIVLEARRVGTGPAGRNSGFMIDLPHDLASENYSGGIEADIAQTSDNRRAIAFAAEMARDFGLSEEAFVISGKINGAASAKGDRHNRNFAAHLRRMGEACDLLDAASMRERTGTDYYTSGLFTSGAAMIQPALFVREVARGLRSNRLSIFEQSPVTALRRTGADWVAETPQGRVTAPRVILTVNGHLESFGYMRGRLMHIFLYASMTRALTPEQSARLGGLPRWGITPADPLGSTVRRISGTGGDRIVVRNRFTYAPGLKVPESRVDWAGRTHDRSFAARFPMLRDVEMEYRWGGRLCLSYNSVQVTGEIEPGLWSACCQNGLGTVKGTLAGLVVAEAANGLSSGTWQRMQAAPAPRRLPPAPAAWLGATARLRWGEWRAGRDR